MVVSTYFHTWKVFLSSWRCDWDNQRKAIDQLATHFQRIPTPASLTWNVIVFIAVQAALLRLAGFSVEFQTFIWATALCPCLLCSLGYYAYKYGGAAFFPSKGGPSIENGVLWIRNWIAMQGIMLVGVTHSAVIYFLGLALEPYIIPSAWQFSVRFPIDLIEEYLCIGIYWFAGLFIFCVATLPLWKEGYRISMIAAGRKHVSISYTETFIELVYQSGQAGAVFFYPVTLAVILQERCGFRMHSIHFIFTFVEISLGYYALHYKFSILHQLMHEIQPLYAMAHVEHHVCKGVHPTTPGAGLWELWLLGHGMYFNHLILTIVPYFTLQSFYMGANIAVHTMWPSMKLLQWHTLHHTVLADVYGGSISSSYDKEHSRTIEKLNEKLSSASPFIRHKVLSDVAGLFFAVILGLFFHYGLGIGFGHVDWTHAEWTYRVDLP